MGIRAFLKTRYRAILGRKDDGDHWLGGAVGLQGANCPNCKIPLVLHWDINCRDPRFRRNKFGPLDRLPLLYCWSCVDDIGYRITDRGGIKILTGKIPGFRGPSFQYEPYPVSFERRPLALDSSFPSEVKAILAKWSQAKNQDSYDLRLSAKSHRILAEYFGHAVNLPFTLIHHQFCGLVPRPRLYWDEIRCPNRQCPARKADGKGRPMSFLAEILNDPWGGLPMVEPATAETRRDWNFLVSVQFSICSKCWTVHACNRCD